jgi:hypothetical protein
MWRFFLSLLILFLESLPFSLIIITRFDSSYRNSLFEKLKSIEGKKQGLQTIVGKMGQPAQFPEVSWPEMKALSESAPCRMFAGADAGAVGMVGSMTKTWRPGLLTDLVSHVRARCSRSPLTFP